MKRCLFSLLLVSLLIPAPNAGAQQIKLRANLQFPLANPIFGGPLARFKD